MSGLAKANKAHSTELGAELRGDRTSSVDNPVSKSNPMPSSEQDNEAVRRDSESESHDDRTSSVSTDASNPHPMPPVPVEKYMTAARTAYFYGDTWTACHMCYNILENPDISFWVKAQAAQIVNDQGPDPNRGAGSLKAEETILALHGIPPDDWDHDAASLSVRIMLKNDRARRNALRNRSPESDLSSVAVTSDGTRASTSIGNGGLDSRVTDYAATLRDPALEDRGEGDQRTEVRYDPVTADQSKTATNDDLVEKHTGLTSPTQATLRPPPAHGLKDASNNQLTDRTAGMHPGQNDQKGPASPDIDPVSAGASYDNLVDRDLGQRLREQDRRGMNLDGAGESHPMGDIPQPSDDVRREVEGKGKAREKKYRSWKNKCCNVS